MSRLVDLFKSLTGTWIPETEVRAEAWALGARHQGDVTGGAKSELRQTGISARRAVLLRAVIRSRKHEAVAP